MTSNPILEELYAARAQIMAEYGNDLGAYLRDAAQRTRAPNHPIAKIKQRTIRSTPAVQSGELSVENPSAPPGDR